MLKNLSGLDKFAIVTGVIGLFADTIAIVGFATGAGLIIPNVQGFSTTPDGILLITGLGGLYSLTMIVWFMLRRKPLNPETKMFGLDSLLHPPWEKKQAFDTEPSEVQNLIVCLIPFFGPFFTYFANISARVIFWIGYFFSLLPCVLWLYLSSTSAWIGFLGGVFVSFLLAQYSTFFALVLDKFFKSIYLDFTN